jgi:hypothetical protein
MTTNEKLNSARYEYTRGEFFVFNRGVCGNFVNFTQICPCCAFSDKVNWFEAYSPIQKTNDFFAHVSGDQGGPMSGGLDLEQLTGRRQNPFTTEFALYEQGYSQTYV